MSAKTILIIDDEDDIRSLLKDILEDEGYKVLQAAHSMQAEHVIDHHNVDLLILDIWLENSDKDGIELLRSLRKTGFDKPVLMISGHGNVDTAVQTIKLGAYDFIEKPFKTERLLLTVKNALEKAQLQEENRSLRQLKDDDGFISDLTGDSKPIEKLRKNIEKIAPTESRVLIYGEAGTGKDIMARYIHKCSARASENYVALNCAILTDEDIEDELFSTKNSVLEKVNGGTLFLDEVSDMPLETQAKFLRVLQDQKIHGAQSGKDIDLDIRVIASTTKDLEMLIRKGQFREDLFYRLNVVPLTMPSLRERVEDIPVLTKQIISQISERLKVPALKLDNDVINLFQLYTWPGNIRELKNIIEWIMIMVPEKRGQSVNLQDLPQDIRLGLEKKTEIASNGANDFGHDVVALPLKEARESFEKQYLLKQIDRFNGNISKTASFIGMERTALHRKLKTLGLLDDIRENAANQA
jgi:two-component system nitrogen regulation response regulator NtrX